jgi:hypothetical protein
MCCRLRLAGYWNLMVYFVQLFGYVIPYDWLATGYFALMCWCVVACYWLDTRIPSISRRVFAFYWLHFTSVVDVASFIIIQHWPLFTPSDKVMSAFKYNVNICTRFFGVNWTLRANSLVMYLSHARTRAPTQLQSRIIYTVHKYIVKWVHVYFQSDHKRKMDIIYMNRE